MIVSIDIKLIHKSNDDNLMLDVLSRREEFMGANLHDTMTLNIIVYCDGFFLIKDIKEAYKSYKDTLEIKKAFAATKSTS